MEEGQEPDAVGDALATTLGYLTQPGNPYPKIADLLYGIMTAEGVASQEHIREVVRFAYLDMDGARKLPAGRVAKVESVADLAMGRLRSRRLLAAREDVRAAADSVVPPDPPLAIEGHEERTLGGVAI